MSETLNSTVWLTQEAYDKLVAELDHLKGEGREEVSRKIAQARSEGDLSENGGYPHPDHIMAHRVAVEAFEAAADPGRYPGTGEAWSVAKLYYDRAFNPERFRALHFALEALAENGRLAGAADLDALRAWVPGLLTFDRWLAGPGAEQLDEALRPAGSH